MVWPTESSIWRTASSGLLRYALYSRHSACRRIDVLFYSVFHSHTLAPPSLAIVLQVEYMPWVVRPLSHYLHCVTVTARLSDKAVASFLYCQDLGLEDTWSVWQPKRIWKTRWMLLVSRNLVYTVFFNVGAGSHAHLFFW